jgi:hypothetical protein
MTGRKGERLRNAGLALLPGRPCSAGALGLAVADSKARSVASWIHVQDVRIE